MTTGLVLLIVFSALTAFFLNIKNDFLPPEVIRIACVGDSLTQSSAYPYGLWGMLGRNAPYTYGNYTKYPENDSGQKSDAPFAVGNFGVGGTMVTLQSLSPYMNTSAFKSALGYQPNIVIIMLGTNDAQPSAHKFNTSFVDDYKTLIYSFQMLASRPRIWVVLPPPIFANQGGKIDPEYFEQFVLPNIKQVANETNLPLIDVNSVLIGYPEYFPDGIHVNLAGAQIIANEVYKAITSKNL